MTSIEPSSSPAMDADQSGVGALPAPDWLQKCRWTLGLTLTCVALLWAGDVPSRLGYAWYQEQFLVVALGLGLALAFLSRSWTSGHLANGKWSRAADITLAVLGLGAGAWVAASYDTLVSGALTGAPSALIVAGILFALVMEALRRVVGLTLVVVVLSICGYGLVGHLVEGSLQTREVAPADLFVYLGFDPNGLLGLTLSIAATVVVAFVFFGQLLLKSGGAEFFNDAALAAMGRRRGGAAKISIVASSLFGSISGVVVSNIVATGVVTIRLMINAGFKRSTAAAIEAVSSTGGQIVPPVMGAVAFLMADILQKPYAEIVFAAIIPAALYYVALYAQADLRAGRDDIKPLEGVEIPQLQSVFRKGWQFLLPFAVIVLALFVLNQRPEAAGLWGAIAVIIVGLIWGYNGRRARLKDILDAASETGRQIVDILMIAAAAGLIIGVLSLTGLGFGLTFSLASLGEGNLLLLLSIAAMVCIILGMGMPTVGVYLLLAVLIAPSLVESGVEPIAAHMFIFYLGMMSMVTPPVAIAAFFAASIAKSRPIPTAFEAMRFGWSAYAVPFLFVVSPTLLMIGPWESVAVSFATAALGVYAVSASMVGFLRIPLGLAARLILGIGGLCLLATPGLVGQWAVWLDVVGFLGVSGIWLSQFATMRREGIRG